MKSAEGIGSGGGGGGGGDDGGDGGHSGRKDARGPSSAEDDRIARAVRRAQAWGGAVAFEIRGAKKELARVLRWPSRGREA